MTFIFWRQLQIETTTEWYNNSTAKTMRAWGVSHSEMIELPRFTPSTLDKSRQGHLCQWDAGKSKTDHHGHLNFVLCVMDKLIYKLKEQSKSCWGNCQSLFFHKSRDGCNLRCWNFPRSCAESLSLQNSQRQKSWEREKSEQMPSLLQHVHT